ncbi:hypothetical protein PHISCL_09188 [Aspergillus sclerotialis]|uniref:Retrotransposon gag domain-containing protein n=1 Tax=Aspergillus sclerotialis TaxID=2070753 RepID=A0A3A2ZKS1_9EURO|nr:hypothetical protein PHISCL_09188 [Aspergillus sclerotialis]
MSDQSALMLLVQQLQQELQNQRIEIQSLRTDLNASRSDVQQLQIQLISRTPAPRSRLPDPPRFNGKPYTLRTWLPSIRAKLRSDQLSGADAFDYVWDRLEQPQQASVLHLRQSAEDSHSWDPEAIFSFFQRLYYNPREQQEAIQRFTSVQQRDEESLVAYLARFERLSYEADATLWPDVSRVTTLHRGLKSTLRQTLENSSDSLFSLSYDEYIELLQRTDRRTRLTRNSTLKPAQIQNSDPMDVAPAQIASIRPARPDSPTSVSSATSSASNRRAFRLYNDLCLYCGSDQHWITTCPTRSRSNSLTPPEIPRTKTTARSPTFSARSAKRPSSKA